MDDIQIVVYIILILFGIVSKVLKKKKEVPNKTATPATGQRKTNQSSGQGQKKAPMSFEDLLKEFTEEPQSAPRPREPEVVDYEEFDYKDETEIQRIFEESVAASKKYDEASHRDDRHTGNFTHFEGYSEEDTEEEESEYAKLLQDDESAKKAIILSEILNRKY
ncbi:hypothetical protein [Fulvivirga sp.]|uniref:hypothetical protein n=1 Tax=Fulvivirga sp. TaxID=1931237 RepID=UPI0032EC15A3